MKVSWLESHPGRARHAILAMTFIMGGCGIAYEYTFSKISSDLVGNSVRQWAVTIGLMMFFMGIGSDLQKHIKDKNLFDKFIIFEICLGLIGGFGPILLLFCFSMLRDHYVLLQYSITTAVGFLIGLELPILTRINEAFTPELKVNIGGVLRMDYVGAFAGALAWVFILPQFFSLIQMSLVLGVFNMVAALVALLFFHRLSAHKATLTATLCASVWALSTGLVLAPKWTRHAEQRLYLDPIVFSETTPYQHIVLTESHAGEIFCYINGNTQFSSLDEYIYHEFLVHPAMLVAPRRGRVLVLGGGDGLAVREVLKYPDVESVTLVDIDPAMTRLARENPYLVAMNRGALKDARVHVVDNHALVPVAGQIRTITNPDQRSSFESDDVPVAEVQLVHMDAATFLDQVAGVYDVIILDFPDPNNLELSKLYSLSFYFDLKRMLSRDGIVVQQSTSPVHSKEVFHCIGRTLEAAGFSVVPFHENVPVFGEWGWWLGGKSSSYEAGKLRQEMGSISRLDLEVRYITPKLIEASLEFGRDFQHVKSGPVNTLMNHEVFDLYQRALTRNQ